MRGIFLLNRMKEENSFLEYVNSFLIKRCCYHKNCLNLPGVFLARSHLGRESVVPIGQDWRKSARTRSTPPFLGIVCFSKALHLYKCIST